MLVGRPMAVERRATMFWLKVVLLRALVAESAIWQLSVEPASSKKLFSSLVSARVPLSELMWMWVASLALPVKTADPAPSSL